MKRLICALASVASTAALIAVPVQAQGVIRQMLSANVMFGVNGAFIGDDHPIRGIPGDDELWADPRIAQVSLSDNGFLRILVRGLVEEDGENPDPNFRGVVSCLTDNRAGFENVFTRPFRANEDGNSLIVQRLDLPTPCVAPIVLVASGEQNVWFAATGTSR